MDFTEIQGVIGWVIGLLSTSVIAIGIGIFNIIRSGKMIPRETRGADLVNNGKEVDVARAWKGLAAETARETLEVNKRLKDLEDKTEVQEDTIKKLELRIEEQDCLIAKQAIRIDEQDRTIEVLETKLTESETYNKELIAQMQKEKITPKSRTKGKYNGTSV